MTVPRRSTRLRVIAFVLLAQAAAVLWTLTLYEIGTGEGRVLDHLVQAVLVTAIALASLRWPGQVGRIQAVVGGLALVFYPIQGAWRQLHMDAVWLVEVIVVVPAFLAGLALLLSTRVRAHEEA